MAEYIDREAAIRMLRGSIVAKYPLSFSSGILASADELEKLSAADVAPVRRGRWIHCKGKSNLWYCSVCGEKIIYNQNKVIYNPNRGTYIVDKKPVYKVNKRCRYCGAKMDENQ